jgi:Tetratricopeptide repeat
MKAIVTGFLVLVLACAGVQPLQGFHTWGPSMALAQTDDVAAAQSLYDQGQFAQAATAIREGLSSGRIFGGAVVAARELLARCQVKTGDVAGARKTFLSILRQDPLYHPDALRVPPDEMAAYNSARQAFDAEREHASLRLPASIEIHYGVGSGDNKDFGEFVASGGGDTKFDNDPLFGGIVRFALVPRYSLDIQIERFRATDADSLGANGATYEITSIPLSVGLSYLVVDKPRVRAYVFAGGGPMLESTASLIIPGSSISVSDDKVGTYLHAGIEGEYRVHPRFAITGRVLGRSAKATKMFDGTDLELYKAGVSIGGRDVDFSGFAATIGVRAYVGY